MNWIIAFMIWLTIEFILGAIIYYKLIQPYVIVWKAYRKPYKYITRNPGSYRGMLKIHGYTKMVNNYLTKNSYKIRR